MLESVKIYGKNEVLLPKKRSKYQNNFMKSNSPNGFSIYEYGNLVFSSYGGLFCPYGSQTKVKRF